MARFPLTLALILISLTFLVTIITAFRLRDLPKTSQEAKKAERKQQKCDYCDVNEKKFSSKFFNAKIDSVKRYEDIKPVVPEKQSVINQKNLKVKFKTKAIDKDELFKTDSSKNTGQEEKVKSWISFFFDNDDDSDDDVDDDNDENYQADNDDDGDYKNDNDDQDGNDDNIYDDDDNDGDDDDNNDEDHGDDDDSDGDDEDNDDDSDGDDEDNDDDDDVNANSEKDIMYEVHKIKIDHKHANTVNNKKQIISKESDKIVNEVSENDEINLNKFATNGVYQSHKEKYEKGENNKRSKILQKKDMQKNFEDYEGDDNIDSTIKVVGKAKNADDIDKNYIITDKKVEISSNKHIDENKVSKDDKDNLKQKNFIKTTLKSDKVDISNSKQIKKKPKSYSGSNEIILDSLVDSNVSPQILKVMNQSSSFVRIEDEKINKIKVHEKSTSKQSNFNVKNNLEKVDVFIKPLSFLDSEEEIEEKFIPKKKNVPEPKLKALGRKESKKDSKEVKIKKEDISKEILKNFSNLVDPPKQKDLKQQEPDDELKQSMLYEAAKFTKTNLPESKNAETSRKQSKETVNSEEAHLKSSFVHMMDALYRRNMLQSEFEDIYAFLPTFAPNFSLIHNPECRRHGQILLRQLRGTKIWALNMLDATGKLPSGILQGNGIQLGDFDQCLGSKARVQLDTGSIVRVQGKYCLAQFDLKAEHPELEIPVHLAQAKNLVKSRIDDPGHFVPRFSTLNWGVCVPSPCIAEDVEVILKDAIKHYQHTSGIVVKVKVDQRDCHTLENFDFWAEWLEWPTVLTLGFYAIIVVLVLIATLQDSCAENKNDKQNENADDKAECDQKGDDEDKVENKRIDSLLSSFSLYRTIKNLTAPGDADEIPCIHGVRAIATIALLVAHKFVPVGVTPYSNRLKVTETASSPLFSWVRAGWVYTDCFLLLSGALTAHRATNTGTPRRILSKYLRLTPALLAVVLFYAYLWEKVSSGPMWGTLVQRNFEICREGWWWNLLYAQNYFGLDEICAPQSHQLALDMQLTVLGGFLVWMAQVKSSSSYFTLPALLLGGSYLRYSTVYEHRLTMLAYHGVSVSQLYRTAKLTYTSAIHRSTPYLVGITLGLALRKPGKPNKFLLILGWLACSGLWTSVWLAVLDSGSTQYRYSASSAAQFAAIAPVSSALAMAWTVYAVHTGSCEFLSRLLCCQPLVLISRLSYALYLTQFIVFLTNAATVRTSKEFTILSLIDIHEICAILLSSIVLTLTLITPMQSILKYVSLKIRKESADLEKRRELEPIIEETEKELQSHTEEEKHKNIDGIKNKKNLIVHREPPEEISEVELELAFELQRKVDGLEEILEEEEGEEMDEEYQNNLDEEEPEIVEEEGGEDFWTERETYNARRNQLPDQDLEEWEWTSSGNGQTGAQYYRHNR